MNLQQHYELIGQILKERPELVDTTVMVGDEDVLEDYLRHVYCDSRYFHLSSNNHLQIENTETLWKSQ